MPGIAWIASMSLEGVTNQGLRALHKAATAIARSSPGVIEDPQEGTFRHPSSVRRYNKPPRSERIDVLSLSWWAVSEPLQSMSGVKEFVMALAARLPEALPGRWGLYEPPDHSLTEEGPTGFAQFLDAHRDEPIMTRGRPPFVNSDYRLVRRCTWKARMFRFEVVHVRIDIDAQLLDQPGWGRQVPEVFTALSAVVQPFYAEARVRKDVDRQRIDFDSRSPVHPIPDNRWAGLPHAPPIAAVLGKPYKSLWPTFGTEIDGLSVAGQPEWSRDQQLPWDAPRNLLQPADPEWRATVGGGFLLPDPPRAVARTWPFDPPPSD